MSLFINEYAPDYQSVEVAGTFVEGESPLYRIEYYAIDSNTGRLELVPNSAVGFEASTANNPVSNNRVIQAAYGARAIALIQTTDGIDTVIDFVDFSISSAPTPTTGAALNMTPELVTVEGAGVSWAKVGTGTSKEDFTWEKQEATLGTLNTGQTYGEPEPEPEPVPTVVTAEAVVAWSGLKNLKPDEITALEQVVLATNVYVDNLPSIDRKADGTWAETTKLGALMLAARLYRRKNTVDGVQAVGELTTYIPRYDNDIARLLNIDTFRKPVIG